LFSASVVFNDLHHPYTKELRRFRADVLKNNLFGQYFMELYNFIGPTTTKYLSKHRLLKKKVR